ncbi:MAG: ribulose-phosphate 3-epimerase [Candidatus Hydrogenedentes bacterium]|nr:ribulose-phosphate 3-epimerase [Candidatus Hydrogenedentota bacterium]
MKPNELKYAPSLMCANFLRLEDDIKALEAGGCDELHFDIMDGSFVPNITLGEDFVRAVRRATKLPFHGHLMIQHPERYVNRFVDAGCTIVSIHVEACIHAHRVLDQIRAAGASPCIAINPATPLTKLEFLLDKADRVLVMTVDPGFAGQRIINGAYERVKILRENIEYRKLKVDIEVDGNIDIQNAAILANLGARVFVLGSSSIFKGNGSLEKSLPEFRSAVDLRRQQV